MQINDALPQLRHIEPRGLWHKLAHAREELKGHAVKAKRIHVGLAQPWVAHGRGCRWPKMPFANCAIGSLPGAGR
jgi:hypothetical protein